MSDKFIFDDGFSPRYSLCLKVTFDVLFFECLVYLFGIVGTKFIDGFDFFFDLCCLNKTPAFLAIERVFFFVHLDRFPI